MLNGKDKFKGVDVTKRLTKSKRKDVKCGLTKKKSHSNKDKR